MLRHLDYVTLRRHSYELLTQVVRDLPSFTLDTVAVQYPGHNPRSTASSKGKDINQTPSIMHALLRHLALQVQP